MSKNWSLPFRYWILSISVALGVYIIWFIRDLYEPLIISALIAFILNPIVSFIAKRTKLSRPLIITIVFLIGLISISFLIIILMPPLITDLQVLFLDIQDIFSQTQEAISQPIIIFGQVFHLENLIPDFTQFLSDSMFALPENAFHVLEATTKNLLWALIMLFTTYYLLKDWAHLRSWFLHIIPEDYRADARKIYQEIKMIWHGYLQGNLVLMLIVGVVFSLAWISIGVPGALVLGIIAGMLTIIPDLGPAIAAGFAILVALFEGSTYLQISNSWFALLVAIVYLVLINIKNIWIRPRIFGRSVHMHEGIVFVAIMVAVVIQGILGAIIVIPLLASASILVRYTYRMVQGIPPWPANNKAEEN